MARTFTLRQGAVEAITAHAHTEAPNECCGLLVGTGEAIDEAVPTRNLAASPATTFVVNPDEHFATIRRVRVEGRSVLGAYHSHPRSAPVPSATDIEQAHDAGFLCVIISLRGPDPDIRAYLIDGGAVSIVRLVYVP